MSLPALPNWLSPTSDSDPAGPDGLIRRLSAVMMLGLVLMVTLLIVGPISTGWSQAVPAAIRILPVSSESEPHPPSTRSEASAPVLAARPSHPSNQLAPYFSPSAPASSSHSPEVLHQFHQLLDQYVHRQTTDDNFTIRVVDRRTYELLELYQLDDLRSAHRQGEDLDWRDIDEHRREAMERLVDKYEERGVPLDAITVRWGRSNQVIEAHVRDRPYQAYELRLAQYLGLSQLATQIGTVETFNQDHLVSAANARSRYQMLPWVLRRSGVNEYTLPTDAGEWIRVREEWHPLLVLEPAFLLVRGYTNAVGHEMPGLSAYHAGPGNIFKLYRHYYHNSGALTTESTVADAYAWALTKGFDTVSENSSFRGSSRGYVPALYGSLKALDQRSSFKSSAMHAARVQLKPGHSVTLKTVLTVLDTTSRSLDWTVASDEDLLYERFRKLNKHLDLPSAHNDSVPPEGNVTFLSSVDGKAVRFFLPLGAPDALRSAGITALNSSATFRYDDSTYAGPAPSQVTQWDREYEALVEDIEHFGFTERNRERLLDLHDQFETLAEEHPSRYRRRQLRIISTHRRLWLSNPWEELADATRVATGRMPVPAQPPEVLSTPEMDFPSLVPLRPE